jgi:hypothetical protein
MLHYGVPALLDADGSGCSLRLTGREPEMDIVEILGQLRQERAQLTEAVVSLERLAQGRGRGRGRPPAWLAQITPKRRGRPRGSKNRKAARAIRSE